MIRNSGTPTLEVEPIIAEMRVEEKSESEVADKTLSNEIPPPIYDFARICRACPEQGDRERVYRHHRQNGDSPQKINGNRACLSFMLYISSILLVCCCCGHRWFLSISFSISTVPMRVDAILSKSQTKQESKRYNGCENAQEPVRLRCCRCRSNWDSLSEEGNWNG